MTSDEQADPAGVVVLQQPDGGLGGADVAHRDGVSGRAQRGGDRGLVARLDRDQRGHRAEHAGQAVAGGEHGAGAVLAGQAELQRVLAGDQGGPLLLGGPLLVPQRCDLVVGGGQPEGGLLVVGVEVLLAGVQPGDLRLDAGELRLRAGGPLAGLLQRRGQPADLGLAGLDLAAPRGRPARPAGPDPRDGRRPPGPRRPPAAARPPATARPPAGPRRRQPAPRGRGRRWPRSPAPRPGPARPRPRAGRGPGRRAASSGSPARCRTRSAARLPVPRNRSRSDDRRYHVSWARVSVGASAAADCSSAVSRSAASASAASTSVAARAQRGLVGHLGLERRGERDQVVGEDPQPRVAQVGLDHRGPPGHLGLPAQRLELAAQLDGEVLDPGEVGLHRVQLAERLLLALAVLEDAGGLLDEPAALLGAGREHRVELALADDDVHLATDARVGQQLLDIEQPARLPVDRVLRAAVAEHGPRDRHLGVVDRQRAVGVVDGQADLGPAQRSPASRTLAAGRAGEDDVLHLAAAQRLGALLAHHPGEGVDDVGLAGPVRPDDGRDARLEVERRGRGEGLEPLEGEALQVHAQNSSVTGRRRPREWADRVRRDGTSAGKAGANPTGRCPHPRQPAAARRTERHQPRNPARNDHGSVIVGGRPRRIHRG